MKAQRSRSPEEVFADMHRELRAWNPKIPESPQRLDPIMRILLQLYANQLAAIDKRVGKTWEIAADSLIKSLSPECKRWPVPAYTVMRCQPLDPVIEIDPHTRFFYKEKREGGQTFFFSSLKKEKLLKARVRHIFLKFGQTVIDRSPSPEGGVSSAAMPAVPFSTDSPGQVFLAVDYDGPQTNLADTLMFFKGAPEALKQLHWAYWYPGSSFGSFYEDSGFCPGMTGGVESLFTSNEKAMDWGGLRSSADVFKPLENSFVLLPEQFSSTWDAGPPSEDLASLFAQNEIDGAAQSESYFWIRLDLPPGGDRTKLLSPLEVFLDCFVVVNKNELTLFKHTGGSRLVELELPEDISSVLEITSVVDSNGREYAAAHQVQLDRSQKYYSLEQRGDRLVLWFDFSSTIDAPPDSITITYSITASVAANAIEAGKITELYESHPGVDEAENVIPTAGAIPARTDEQVVSEASARLRSRDRALSFTEIANWAQTFDPRIRRVHCENGVERTDRGVRRCIIVRVTVPREEFYSDDEVVVLHKRLGSFLKARSPVNTQFQIEIIKE